MVGDLSFISLRLVLPAVKALLRPGGRAVLLVKPQFEVGKGEVGKGGVVREDAKRIAALEGVMAAARELGLRGAGARRVAHRRAGRKPGVAAGACSAVLTE